MASGSFNGGGTFWVGADFGESDPDSHAPPSWRSKYPQEISESKFEKSLPAILSARRLDLKSLAKDDTSYAMELRLVELFLSDPVTHFTDAKSYVMGPRKAVG
jgi:hypothetical protein